MTTAPPPPTLPVAVVGSDCRDDSTPTVDPDGVRVYCARIQYTDGYTWSRIPDVAPIPLGGITWEESNSEFICVQQTGWSLTKCSTAIAKATYRGDGRDSME